MSSLTALGVMSSMGQGQINANPGGTTGVYVMVQDPNVDSGTAVKIGPAATTAGFTGVGGGQVTISMYVAPVGTSLQALEATTPIASIVNPTSALGAGTFNISTAYNLTTTPGAGYVPGWNGSSALDVIFYGAGGIYGGWSAEATGITAATGIGQPPAVFGTTAGLVNSFVLTPPVPEPSTIVLGGLGAAALLAFRRRK